MIGRRKVDHAESLRKCEAASLAETREWASETLLFMFVSSKLQCRHRGPTKHFDFWLFDDVTRWPSLALSLLLAHISLRRARALGLCKKAPHAEIMKMWNTKMIWVEKKSNCLNAMQNELEILLLCDRARLWKVIGWENFWLRLQSSRDFVFTLSSQNSDTILTTSQVTRFFHFPSLVIRPIICITSAVYIPKNEIMNSANLKFADKKCAHEESWKLLQVIRRRSPKKPICLNVSEC